MSDTPYANKPNFFEIESVDQFTTLMKEDLRRPSLLSFWASFAEPCKEMNKFVKEQANKYKTVQVLSVRCDETFIGGL